jgi:hypothetical protein
VSSFACLALDQIHLSFVKGLHHQSCRCSLLVSCFSYMPATMKNTRQGNVFSRQRCSIIFLQVIYFLLFSRVSEYFLAVILIITFLHNFAFSAGTFYLALFFQVRLPRLYVINIFLAHIIDRQLLELRPWNLESRFYLTPLGRPWHPCRWLGSLGTGNNGLMTPVVKTG